MTGRGICPEMQTQRPVVPLRGQAVCVASGETLRILPGWKRLDTWAVRLGGIARRSVDADRRHAAGGFV